MGIKIGRCDCILLMRVLDRREVVTEKGLMTGWDVWKDVYYTFKNVMGFVIVTSHVYGGLCVV